MPGVAEPLLSAELYSPEVIVPLLVVALAAVRFGWAATLKCLIVPGALVFVVVPAVMSRTILDFLATISLIGIGVVFHYRFLDGLPCGGSPKIRRANAAISWTTFLDGIASVLLTSSSAFFISLLAARLP